MDITTLKQVEALFIISFAVISAGLLVRGTAGIVKDILRYREGR